MGREGGRDIKTFKTKGEADAYLKNMKQKNDEALKNGGNDSSDTGWGHTEAYGSFQVFRLDDNFKPYESYEEARTDMWKITRQKNPGDFSIVYVVAKYRPSDANAEKKAVDKAFKRKKVVKAFEDCAEYADYNFVPVDISKEEKSALGVSPGCYIGDKNPSWEVSPEKFRFAKCWNCHSVVNIAVMHEAAKEFKKGCCPVCKRYNYFSLKDGQWSVLFYDRHPENPDERVENSERTEAFKNSTKIPWQKKKRKWIEGCYGYYGRKPGHYVDDGMEASTDRMTLTMVRSLYPLEYEKKVEVARKRVRSVVKAKSRAMKAAASSEPEWIVASEWTSAHF